MKKISIDILSILRYIMNTLQFLDIEEEELDKYFDEKNLFYDLEDLEVNKFKFFKYYTSNYNLTSIYQLSNIEKDNLNLNFLFLKNNHNKKFFNYHIFFDEVFNKELNITYLIYSVVDYDRISSFIMFKNNEDYSIIKKYLEDLEVNSKLTIKNFLKLSNIEDKSFFFNKKELELLELIDNFKFSIIEKEEEDLEEKLRLIEDILDLIDLKIDLFKSIMKNNATKINTSIKTKNTSINTKKIRLNFLIKNTSLLKEYTSFYKEEKDLVYLEKDLEVLNTLNAKYSSFYDEKTLLEKELEELRIKEDNFKNSSYYEEDSCDSYDNFNYYSYYKNF